MCAHTTMATQRHMATTQQNLTQAWPPPQAPRGCGTHTDARALQMDGFSATMSTTGSPLMTARGKPVAAGHRTNSTTPAAGVPPAPIAL